MRLLMVVLFAAVLGCGERSMPVKPAGKATTDCSMAEILAGTCSDTDCSMAEILAGTCSDTADPTLDEVPDGYVAPVDSTAAAAGDSTVTEEVMPEAYERHYISLEIDSDFTPEEYDSD